jgi:hypothetical protein
MISDACAPNISSSAPSSRVCLSFGCSKQAAGNDARYEAREEHGKIDCWHGQPSFIPAGFSFLSVLPPRCLRLAAGLRGGGRPRSPVGERDPGRDRTHPAYYEFNREPLSHSCSRFEPVAPICAPRLEARWLGVDDCAILSPCGRRAPSGESTLSHKESGRERADWSRQVDRLPDKAPLRARQPGGSTQRRAAPRSGAQVQRQGGSLAGGDCLLEPAGRPRPLDAGAAGRRDGQAHHA